MLNLESIKEKFSYCDAIRELSATFELYLSGNAPQPLVIKIYREDYQFIPEMSHFYQASGAGGPHYPDFHPKESIDAALNEVFVHGLMFYTPNDSGGKWIERHDNS